MRYLPKPYGGAVGPARFITLIGLMVVVGMLMYRARDASTWRWLGSDDSARETKEDTPAGDGNIADALAPPPTASGPTDADDEERDAAEEEFQAINDGTLDLGREEMPAYWRLFSWANRQPLALMQSRTKNADPPRLNDLLLHAGEQRGKLIRLKLNVRQVIEFPAPENPDKIKKIYQMVGFVDQSQSWLYYVLTSEVPPGFKVGDHVSETVWVYGYLLKVQGYRDGQAEEKLRKAPLIIGRISWRPSASTMPKPDLDPRISMGIVIAVAVLCAASVVGFVVFNKGKSRRKPGPPVSTADPQEVSSWLSDASNDASRDAVEAEVVHLPPGGSHRDPGDTIVGS